MIVLCCLIKKKSLDSWNSVSKSSADRHSSWYKRWFLGSPAAAALRFPTLTEADIFGGRSISLKGKVKKKKTKKKTTSNICFLSVWRWIVHVVTQQFSEQKVFQRDVGFGNCCWYDFSSGSIFNALTPKAVENDAFLLCGRCSTQFWWAEPDEVHHCFLADECKIKEVASLHPSALRCSWEGSVKFTAGAVSLLL